MDKRFLDLMGFHVIRVKLESKNLKFRVFGLLETNSE